MKKLKSAILPAILEGTSQEIEDKIDLVKSEVEIVQIDIMDGLMTPKKSWPYLDNETTSPKQIDSKGLNIEYHLMLQDNMPFLEKYLSDDVSGVLMQIESRDFQKSLKYLENKGIYVGASVMLDSSLHELEPFISKIDLLQFMSIEQIGVQGSKFSDKVYHKVDQFKKEYPSYANKLTLAVDGGVSLEKIERLASYGIKRFAIGSAIFRSDDVVATLHKMSEKLTVAF